MYEIAGWSQLSLECRLHKHRWILDLRLQTRIHWQSNLQRNILNIPAPTLIHLFFQCYDIDECMIPELNTCSGGMYPYGFSADVISPASYTPEFYMGPGGADGFSQDFVFEAKGYQKLFIRLGNGPDPAEKYFVILGTNGNTRVRIVKRPGQGELLIADHATNHEMALKTDQFTSYRIQLVLEGPSKLKINVGHGSDTFVNFASATDEEDIIAVDTVGVFAGNNLLRPIQVRNFRHAGSADVCSNYVGGFVCTSTEEEYMAIGYGGHTTSGSSYPSTFTVLRKDEYACHDHGIPNLSGRYKPEIAVIDTFLFVCGGNWYGHTYSIASCHKLDLDQYSPSWQSFTSMPLARKHFTLDVYGDYM